MLKKSFIFLSPLCAAILFASCLKHPSESVQAPVASSFDFSTTRDYQLKVDYKQNFSVQFEVYTENPFATVTIGESTQKLKNNDIKPIFRAFTDNSGKFDGTMQCPSFSDEFYIFCNYPGTPSLVTATVAGTVISMDASRTASGTVSRSGITTPVYKVQDDDFGTFYTYASNPLWDQQTGYPNWLLSDRYPVPQKLVDDISAIFVEGQNAPLTHPEYFTGGKSHNIHISLAKAAPVKMVFLHGITSYNDVMGYYSYVGTAPQSAADIHRTFVFPNAKYDGMGGGLKIGDQVDLKYWNPATSAYEDEFPAGSVIGVFMCSNGYHPYSGTVWRAGGVFYTDYKLSDPRTPGGNSYQQGFSLYSQENSMVIVGFEDIPFDDPSCDSDFNDVIVGIQSPGIDGSFNNPLPEDEFDYEKNTLEFSGTLAFEDLWPNEGDYDMNDVVVKYYSKVWRNRANLIIKVEDKFMPVHCGAQFFNGFGYQYGVGAERIATLEWSTTYPGGKPTTFDIDPQTCLERGQGKATVMLFDDITGDVVNAAAPYEYNITTTFMWPLRDWELGVPPYNPFIVKRNMSRTQRNVEVHLCGYYSPTDLVDMTFFGTHNDCSRVNDRYYYTGVNNMPFAIKFPGEFNWPRESVRIDVAYPDFAKWVASGGWEYTNWWVKK